MSVEGKPIQRCPRPGCNGPLYRDDDLRQGVSCQRCLRCGHEQLGSLPRTWRSSELERFVDITAPDLTLFDILLWFWSVADSGLEARERAVLGPKALEMLLLRSRRAVHDLLAERKRR